MKIIAQKSLCLSLAALALCAATWTARADYAAEVLAQQPLTYWRFSEAAPFTWPDNVATNLGTEGATANGAYSDQYAAKGAPGALAGSTDTAAAFSGTLSKIDVPFDAALNPASFTVECWAKAQGGAGSYRSPVTSRESAGGVAAGYMFYANSGNTWAFWTGNGSGWNTLTTTVTNGPVVLGAWTHLVGTYDASSLTMSFYINGALVLQQTNVTVVPVGTAGSPRPLRVGAGATEGAGNYWFNGSVDEVAVYPSVLTAAQVAAHYGTATTNGTAYAAQVLAAQPVLYLRLDEPVIANPQATNLGSLGAAANGYYMNGLQPATSDLLPPTFPGLEVTNRDVAYDGTGKWMKIGRTNVPVPWTAVCWVNRQDAPGVSAVLMYSSSGGLKLEQYNNTRQVGFTAYGVADYIFNYSAPAGTWVNLAFVATPSGTLLYANGELQDSNSASITLPMTTLGHPTSDLLNGEVDEVSTFNRALLQGQLKTLYLTAIGDQNPPGFVNNVPLTSPAGTIYATTPFTLSIDAYGAGPLSFEWRKDGTPISTSANYSVASAALTDNGNYDVIITNAFGAVTSAVFTVTVNPAVPVTITQPPAARSVYAGGNATFSVAAAGTAPITYQWKKSGTNIAGATTPTLVLTNVSSSDAATYSVGVTNVAGGLVSAGAALTLRTPPAGSYEAAIAAAGPIAYWRLGEQSGTTAFDYYGGHDGLYSNVTLGLPGYSPLDPNTSVGFDTNVTSRVIVSNSAPFNFTGNAPTFTLEAWGYFTNLDGIQRIFANGLPGGYGIGFGINTASGLRFTTYGVQDFDQALPTPLVTNTWYHLVGVANGGTFSFYVNGQLAGAIAFTGAGLSSSLPFELGGNPSATAETVNGQIDEVAVYAYALTAGQIQAHYSFGRYGSTTPPLIVQQPAPQTAVAGGSATFSVQAGGSIPLAYQWNKGTTPLSGATNASLTLANISFADAGSYSVAVTNALGVTNSAPATLTVLPMPTFANLTNSLVLHLKFDGNVSDSSGRTNDAIPYGSPATVPGKLGQAIEMKTDKNNGIYNYLQLPDVNGDLSFDTTNSFTTAVWLKFTTGFNDLPIIGNAVNSTYQKGWVLSEDNNQFEWTAVGVDTGSIIADPAGGPLINDGAWHHVAVAFDRAGGQAVSYVDGVRVNARSIASLGTLITGNTLTIGQDPTGGYGVDGTFDLDDLGIWRRALSDYEVLSIYAAAQNFSQSFDVYGSVKLAIQAAGQNIILGWQAGTLQYADELQSNPAQTVWTNVTGAAPPTYTITPGGAHRFYRIKL